METLAQDYQMPTSLREQEKLLKPRAGLGKQDISAPGEGGRGLVFLRSCLLDQHILNGPLLAATCMHGPRVDKKEQKTGYPSVGGQAGGLYRGPAFLPCHLLQFHYSGARGRKASR